MSSLLRLYLSAGWPAQEASCDWILLDGSGHQLQRGRSEPRHWPEAEACEAVLSVEQCLLLNIQLPKASKSRLGEVIRFAVEDHLLGDAEAEHFVPGDKDADGMAPVWVIARARLKTLLAALNSLSRIPQRVFCEIQLLPLADDHWSICLRETSPGDGEPVRIMGFARTGVEQGFAFESADPSAMDSPPLELQLALQAAAVSGKAPRAITLYLAPGSAVDGAAIAASWQDALHVPVQAAGEFAWQEQVRAANEARNLLTQEFAPPRRPQEGWGPFRLAGYLALANCVIFALFVLGDWAWLSYQSKNLQRQMTTTFHSAFPQIQALVDPPLQMQRLYDQQRREQGQLGSGDFLPLLAGSTEVAIGQGKLDKIAYEDGRLELSFIVANTKIAESLRDTMKGRGLSVTLRETLPVKSGGKGVEAVYALRGTP